MFVVCLEILLLICWVGFVFSLFLRDVSGCMLHKVLSLAQFSRCKESQDLKRTPKGGTYHSSCFVYDGIPKLLHSTMVVHDINASVGEIVTDESGGEIAGCLLTQQGLL